ARGELGVGGGRGEVGGGGGGGEADHRAVDVDADRAVRGGLAGGRIDPGEQVGPGGGQVEDLVLVDLAGVEPCGGRLGGPQAQLRVPQRAVGVGVPRVGQGREVTEYVQQVPAVAQGVDHRGVGRGGVRRGEPVLDQVHEPLRVRVARAGLAVDEAEQPLAGRAEEVIPAVERGVVQRGNVDR